MSLGEQTPESLELEANKVDRKLKQLQTLLPKAHERPNSPWSITHETTESQAVEQLPTSTQFVKAPSARSLHSNFPQSRSLASEGSRSQRTSKHSKTSTRRAARARTAPTESRSRTKRLSVCPPFNHTSHKRTQRRAETFKLRDSAPSCGQSKRCSVPPPQAKLSERCKSCSDLRHVRELILTKPWLDSALKQRQLRDAERTRGKTALNTTIPINEFGERTSWRKLPRHSFDLFENEPYQCKQPWQSPFRALKHSTSALDTRVETDSQNHARVWDFYSTVTKVQCERTDDLPSVIQQDINRRQRRTYERRMRHSTSSSQLW